mmetsp:Transcript_5695/g.16190  ORF Transcript_5695/g.16190 Transcript_5695/m.16190 type:complete len:286 (-) Transcript_5695:58-915(-)
MPMSLLGTDNARWYTRSKNALVAMFVVGTESFALDFVAAACAPGAGANGVSIAWDGARGSARPASDRSRASAWPWRLLTRYTQKASRLRPAKDDSVRSARSMPAASVSRIAGAGESMGGGAARTITATRGAAGRSAGWAKPRRLGAAPPPRGPGANIRPRMLRTAAGTSYDWPGCIAWSVCCSQRPSTQATLDWVRSVVRPSLTISLRTWFTSLWICPSLPENQDELLMNDELLAHAPEPFCTEPWKLRRRNWPLALWAAPARSIRTARALFMAFAGAALGRVCG